MTDGSLDRTALLVADILAAPEALEHLLDAYGAPSGPLNAIERGYLRRRGRRVALVGLGSSRYAGLTAASRLRRAGIAAWADHASDTLGPAPATDLVVVAISASGATSEVVETARRHRGRSLVIAVTNAPDPRLAAEADVVLPLYAGIEASGLATRTYRATVAVLELLAERLIGDGADGVDRLRPAVAGLTSLLERRETWLGPVADLLDGAVRIDVIGSAADQGTVEQAALMLREAPRIAATAYETGDWLHTAIYLALPGHRALLFRGAPTDAEVVRVIGGRGGATVVVGDGDALDGAALSIPVGAPTEVHRGDTAGTDPIDALVRPLVGELLAAELWRRTSAFDKAT